MVQSRPKVTRLYHRCHQVSDTHAGHTHGRSFAYSTDAPCGGESIVDRPNLSVEIPHVADPRKLARHCPPFSPLSHGKRGVHKERLMMRFCVHNV
jgi:hypothetical protein